MARVPKEFHYVFQEADPKQLDTERDSEPIMETILEEGPLEGVHWLRKTFGDEQIKQFIITKGRHTLSAMKIVGK